MRGRLIFPFLAELHRLDTAAMAGPGPGPHASGYDADFREPVLEDSDDGLAEAFRREFPPVRVPCQVEPDAFESLRMTPSGNSPGRASSSSSTSETWSASASSTPLPATPSSVPVTGWAPSTTSRAPSCRL